MADSSDDRHDYSSGNLGVATGNLYNQYNSAEMGATHITGVETDSDIEDINLSNKGDHKVHNIFKQYQSVCHNAARSDEKTLVNSLGLSSSASIGSSRLDAEDSVNNTNKNSFLGFEHDQQLNVYIKTEDMHTVDKQQRSITSGVNNSVNNEEIVLPKDLKDTNTEEKNCNRNEEEAYCLEEVTFESEEKERSVENSSRLQSELQSKDNIELLVIDEWETDQKSLDSWTDESNEISHFKQKQARESEATDNIELLVIDEWETDQKSLDSWKDESNEISHFKQKQARESEATDNIEDLMTHLLSFAHFQIRDVLVYMVPTVKWHPQAIDDIPWNWLNEEKWRLHTYSHYPHGANKSAILLAEAGFAYLGSGKSNDDKVICYFCCAVKQDWQPCDVIPEVHKNLSPDCSMVTRRNCNNVPMTMPECGLHLFSQLHNSRDILASEDTRQKARDDIERDGAEPSQANGQANPSAHSVLSNQNGTSAPVRHFVMATQTIMKPSTSQAVQSTATGVTRFSQPTGSDVPSTTVTSNSILTSPASSEPEPSGILMAVPQEGQNSVSAETQMVDTSNQNVHPSSDQTVLSSSATVVSQVSQGNSTRNQNSAAVTSLPSVTTSTSTINSTTSAPPPSSQNTSESQSATQSQVNVSHTSDSQNSSRSAGRNPTYGELGIITERPKRYEFAVRAKRFESFEPWPRHHHLKKEDLADAGFYYAGYGDCARCFYCGGGLRNWEDNDDVWVEHARWFPKCAFIRQTMGQQFVDAVQDLNKSHDQITFEMVTNRMGSSAASFQLDTKNMPLKRDPAVITVLAMGYQDKDVLEAANFVKESCGVLSADKLFEKLEQDGKHRDQTESPGESQAIRNSKESKDEEVMKQLKEQNNQLRQQTVCKICMDKEVAVVFLPCGHLVSCTDCAAALKDCPVCRNLVRGIVRAFMA